jgi:hypothetical protein
MQECPRNTFVVVARLDPVSGSFDVGDSYFVQNASEPHVVGPKVSHSKHTGWNLVRAIEQRCPRVIRRSVDV